MSDEVGKFRSEESDGNALLPIFAVVVVDTAGAGAYSLAASFGGDFSKMLVSGKTPFKGMPKIPSGQRIKSGLGGKARFPACENFGRSPGLIGLGASQVGMPPSWTDKQRLAAD